jgi:LDH2 family malate/lactate/ureidoglycolate dehydrogenase
MSAHDGDEQILIGLEEARKVTGRAVMSLGFDAADAALIVGHLVLNATSGYPFAGLPRVLAMRDAPWLKRPRQPLRVVKETPVSLALDGGNQIAYVAVTRAAEMALAKARQSGVCVMAMANSWYSGRLANYLEPAARAGFVAIHTASAIPSTAPHGAAKAAFGTNPICVALPCEPDPYIVDLGTSQTMKGHVALQRFLGIPLNSGEGIDSEGKPTTDAAKVLGGGAILTMAGHRGSALSFAVQALGLLGAGGLAPEQNEGWGYLFVMFDPDHLTTRGRFQQDLKALVARIKDLPRQPGVEEIFVPSERSHRARREAEASGMVPVGRKVLDELRRMGGNS